MPIIVKIQDIDEAIENLRYKNETTLKSKLLRAVRQYYLDDTAVESLQAIETEELVKIVWETGDDSNLLKAKRKNFSSLKSSVNSDLKKLYTEGKNPQGIVIGHNNVFSISDEAKDKALAGIMDVFKEKGIDTQSKISEILSALSDILSTAVSETEAENTKEEIDRLKDILGGISGKLGLSLQDIIRRAEDKGGGGAQMAGSDNTQMDLPGKGEDLSGYIRGGLSMIDQGLQGLAREIEEASSRPSQKSIVESVRTAIDDIIQVLKDSKTDESGKAQKIMVSATRMITDSIEAVGSGLSGDQAGRLKQIFHEMTEGMGEGNLASDRPATAAQLAGGEWLAAISAILGDGGLSAGEKIGKIMATVNDLLGDTLVKTGAGLGDDDQARIREMMDNISGNIEALMQESFARAESSGVVEESMRKAFAQMIQALQDTGMDAAGKAAKIMAAVEGLLSEAIDASGSGLSGDQADELKQIIHGITEGAGAAEPLSDETAEQAGIAGNQLIQSVSAILGDGELSTGDKIGKIMSTLNEMIGDALDKGGAGLSDEDQARVREMLRNITGSLEALAGLEIVEEIVEEGAGESVEVLEEFVDGDRAEQTAGLEEISDDIGADVVVEDAGASAVDETIEIVEEIAAEGAGESVEVIEEVVEGGADQATAEWEESDGFIDAGAGIEETGTGAADEGIENMEDASAGAMEETLAGTETTDRVKEAMQAALAGIAEAIQDTGTDAASKVEKIMAAVEGLLSEAIDASGSGLSGDQADELKQIIHGITEGAGAAEPLSDETAEQAGIAGNQLIQSVSAILGDGELSTGDKIGKIMSTLNEMIGDALDKGGAGLSDEDQARVREMLHNITGSLDALAGMEIVEEIVEEGAGESLEVIEEVVEGGADQSTVEWEESGEFIDTGVAIDETDAGAVDEGIENIEDASAEAMDETFAGAEAIDHIKEAMQAALAGLVEAIQDTGMDAAGKAGKIMAAVEGMLDQAIGASGGGLSGDQVDELKQIFHEMAEGAREGNLATDQMATPAQIAGGDLLAMVSTILSDGGLSAADKVGKIMAAVNDLVGNALGGADAGLNEDEIAEIKAVMANVTGNLDAFAQGALSIEETVEDDAGPAGEGDGLAEVAEGEVMLSEETGAVQSAEEQVQNIEGLSDVSGDVEEIVEGVAGENAAFVEEIVGDGAVIAEAGVGDESVEFVEVESNATGGFEEVLEEGAAPETPLAELGAEGETVEEFADQEFVEEIIEDADERESGITVTPANQNIDDDLREKTDLLTRLAEAAGMLQGLGPDLNGSIYTEEEIRGKAQFLSEEFDHYLSIRDKFYNAHILIKGGDYLVGGAHLAKSVLEEQIVTLPDFYIGKFPVTNALFEIFVEQTGYVTTAERYGYSLVYFPRMQRSRDPITGVERFSLHNQAYSKKVPGACWHRPLGPDSSLYLKRTHPVVQVSIDDAQAFAAWTGKRIPTEIEWEAAARTAQGLIYPWGNDWQDNACNVEQSLHGDTTPVDRYVKFANPFEVADMLGNVLEWTSDVIGDRETSDTYIVKGASWISHHEISLTDRHYLEKSMSSNILGFRCVAI